MATFTGTSGNDSLPPPGSDTSGSDLLYGLAGNDTLDGGIGADRMSGGTENDTYYVDDVGDLAIEGAGGGTLDNVQSTISHTLRLNVEVLSLNGLANINGTDNSLGNSIFGNGGANSLKGLVGDDYIGGYGGNDTLEGGAGADYLDGGDGVDTASYSTSTVDVAVDLRFAL
jgi:Ca2+-binding RTX toxin-like protein